MLSSRSESPAKRFSVFDFDPNDVVEVESAKSCAKFRNSSRASNKTNKLKFHPISKYTFLQYFAQEAHTPLNEISNVNLDDEISGVRVHEVSSSSNPKNEPVCKISDDEDALDMCSPSTSICTSSEKEEIEEEEASETGCSGCDNVETALGNLFIESKYSRRAGRENETSGTKQSRCADFDPHLSKRQGKDKSSDVRYGDTWNCTFHSDKPFEDVIYPKGDPDAVSISKRDFELLEPETFINDTIIDFYIQYLKSNIHPEEKHRFHFFNSFFFRKLADLDKDPSCSFERQAFQRIRKWTRKVNLFEKDYIFIPVNYRLHWSLIVICHPGEVANCEDEGVESLMKLPCILHMDSIKGSHRDVKKLIQRYLCEEWKERHDDAAEGYSLRFLQLRFFELKLPQQENFSDCGLFLLHYVECFLREAPINFSPYKIKEQSNFLKENWFPPAEASLKRHQIKKLLYDILAQSQEAHMDDCIHSHSSPQVLKNIDNNETAVKHFEELNSTQVTHGNCLRSDAHGIRGTLLGASQPSQVRPADTNYLALTTNDTRCAVSPIQEHGDSGEKMADSPVDIEACRLGTAFAPDLLTSDTSRDHGLSKNIGDSTDVNSAVETSSSESENAELGTDEDESLVEVEGFTDPRKTERSESSSSVDRTACVVQDCEENIDGGSDNCGVVWIDDYDSLVELEVFNHSRKTEKSESPLTGDLTACVVQNSEDESDMQDDNSSSNVANQQFSNQEADATGNINHIEILSSDDEASESDEPRVRKRLRLISPVYGRRRTSLMRALHL